MPRIRTIKPEITTDEKLARVSRDARLTFFYCISQADDDGLLLGNDRQLLAALYPLDNSVTYRLLAEWVEELVDIGVLRWRATLEGSPVLQITNWGSHQKIDHKGKSLLLPRLREWREDDARPSRDSREDLANISRSDLGPRTVDQGPRTKDQSPRTAAAVVKRETWITPYADAWHAQYDGDMPIEPALRPLGKIRGKHGDAEALRRWRIYLAATEGRFANPAKFASTWGQWAAERAPPNGNGAKPTAADAMAASMSRLFTAIPEP